MDKKAFKRGYLFSMAANGLTPDRLQVLLHKQAQLANNSLEKKAFPLAPRIMVDPSNTAKNVLKGVGSFLALPMAAGAVTGTLGGGLAYALTRENYDQQIQDLKDKEKINTVRQEILKLQRRLRRQRAGQRRPVVM